MSRVKLRRALAREIEPIEALEIIAEQVDALAQALSLDPQARNAPAGFAELGQKIARAKAGVEIKRRDRSALDAP